MIFELSAYSDKEIKQDKNLFWLIAISNCQNEKEQDKLVNWLEQVQWIGVNESY